MKLLGRHNVLNAAAAISVCINLGVNINIIKKSLKKFSGVQRRMTKIFTKNQNEFYDDYAHHPTEIKSILEGVKNVYKNKNVISVFEPHRYSRVLSLKKEFARSFRNSDIVLLCPLYEAGERKNPKYNQTKFAKSISTLSNVQVVVIKSQNELNKFIKSNLKNNEIVIGMGAGLVTKWMKELKDIV